MKNNMNGSLWEIQGFIPENDGLQYSRQTAWPFKERSWIGGSELVLPQ